MRRRGPDELHTTSYRKGLTHTCKNCLQLGHNKASCKNPTNPRSKLYKGNPANEEIQNSQGAPPSSSQGPSTSVAPTNSSTPRSNVSSSVAPSSTQPSSSIQDQSVAAPGRVYVGRRNEGLLGRSKKIKNPRATNQTQRVPAVVPTVPPTSQAAVPPMATANVPPNVPNSSNPPVRKRKPQISEVLHNIREAAKKKRIWKV
ncbi:PREDICTED: putative protein TPRXL [Erythranthe guttata]|uniref:putative protein TPRXL n=1 Tax=Erythranthe guttata TaxID=4155 RepID=UPI00064DBEDF|nr:PREDICTED: putative protein TPRXL [Erythranthe guttata]|eukprot:XP_012849591.1 PREDICTED: putative protein TPRXL [Erythranthe guttata]